MGQFRSEILEFARDLSKARVDVMKARPEELRLMLVGEAIDLWSNPIFWARCKMALIF